MKTQTQTVNETAATKLAYSYIRFSTPEQQLGDSERRQLALAESWCARNGYRLADTCADKGKSAFHGKNHTTGNLGALLKRMKPGQALLIEDCDRWSREDPLDALTRLRAEVERGIEVVFLRTGQLVTRANFSDMAVVVPNFFGSLLANQESAKKAERVKAAWDAKKTTAASGKPVRLNRLKCWLAWDEEQGKATVNEARAATVKQIFEWAAQGQGMLEITRALVSANIPPLTSSKKVRRWNATFIRNLLTDAAVLGHYTGTTPPTKNVWPQIVDETLYAVVQNNLASKPTDKRPGHASERNLLTGVARCGCCGTSNLVLHWRTPTNPRLRCHGAAAGRTQCGHKSAPYTLVEQSLLSLLADADLLRPLLASPEQKPSRLQELEARQAEAQKMAAKLAKLILGDDDPSPTVYARLKQEEARAKQLAGEIEAEQLRVKGEQPALVAYGDFLASLPALAADPARRPELRRAVASVVQGITLDPHGDGNGGWSYTAHLRGASEPVRVDLHTGNHEGWEYRSLRPAEYLQAGQNVIG